MVAKSARTLPLASPIDGSSFGELAVADAAQVDAIVQRAHAAFQTWGRTPVKDRVQPLYRFKALVEKNLRADRGDGLARKWEDRG